ncbi:MAG: 6-hydroxycyclohex-1-ene-1-carbonyl-CoA dehydrogenase [Bdellovibrionales bacterium]|jgi:6-hydroxycyclohex-1-ene-1-carbonyl-CoA dehydrogenase|nr:6-hydroxycyclohex-1-ene-1-carbonyl-CoA dehydrogenase [Bdellovibrionales bacterium]MBT3526192.1 6-hydroxycyclohex-1-ene-1-carbonyl-CoA dehydrogenase [Bdellovibrionales bacterium]MBT7668011.1 6-hydroxycyclohex-1-ene-1-carbonyl-CoA dehydrogenase [Bdellovibrionales bacterium]MBT7767965.1 6-hydroxycyclohex-1-ene-1-carbonyl-CoA dehydrogenase [Bdellovibrionales bacterium]
MQQISASGQFYLEAGKPFERRDFTLVIDQADQLIVEVAGCGLCHTDISFYSGQVATKQPLPIVLGHEISGKVVAAGEQYAKLIGKSVVVPAVLPCGECSLCQSGRDNICQQQLMPGNDFNGGFATHLKLPGRHICVLPEELGNLELSQLSVVADAITTPYQSILRSGLQKGEVAIVIGVGGVGIYMVQHARNVGAHVIALDIDQGKLDHAKTMGAEATLMVKGLSDRDVKKAVRALVKEHSYPSVGHKVFEVSGTAAGQNVAFSLLTFAGTLGVVGFTMEKSNLRLSNIMAFDADVFGNWGCRPAYYDNVVESAIAGEIDIKSNVEPFPLDSINQVVGMAMEHKLEKRAIFIP